MSTAASGLWLLDKAGQLIRRRDTQGRETALEWDAFGRLRNLSPPAGDRYGYLYDALGRRICKARMSNPLRNTPAETTWFIWDGDAMVGEVKHRMQGADKPAGVNTHKWQAQFYSYHLGSFVPLAMQVQALENESVGKKLYIYQNDPNGMPLRLLDENAIIAWEGHYSAFGLVDRVSVEAVGQPLRLQGHYFDAESELCYNRIECLGDNDGLLL